MYRLFAALPVPEDLWEGLAALQDGLPGASWRPEENFHITLRFFGDLTHARHGTSTTCWGTSAARHSKSR
jgi:2'-5' RNA ligase